MIPQTARTRIGASVIVGAFVVTGVAACSPMAVPATSTPSTTTASDAPIVPVSAAESAEDPTAPPLVCADAYTLDKTTTCPWRGLGADNPDEFVRTSVAGGKVTVECDYGERCGWQPAELPQGPTCPWRGLGADNPEEFVRTSVAGGKVTVECDYGEQCGWQLAVFGPGGKLVCESGEVGGNG